MTRNDDPICGVCGEARSLHVETADGPFTHPREARGEGTYTLVSPGYTMSGAMGSFPHNDDIDMPPTYRFDRFGYCTTCKFELHKIIARLKVSTLGLYDDARFPGRALLVLNDHHDDLALMPIELAQAFLDDIRCAALAIQRATSADRMNYAVLGNAEPHVHAHLIPRKREGDPVPTKAPWAHPDPVRPLDSVYLQVIVGKIRAELPKI
jgi:diadenosine tetraphosphate (Ap4A) HIT family hydrolase